MQGLKEKINNRIKELEAEQQRNFELSTSKDTHILMKVHFRNTANELQRVVLEFENILSVKE